MYIHMYSVHIVHRSQAVMVDNVHTVLPVHHCTRTVWTGGGGGGR
jgi:hypothetical protein